MQSLRCFQSQWKRCKNQKSLIMQRSKFRRGTYVTADTVLQGKMIPVVNEDQVQSSAKLANVYVKHKNCQVKVHPYRLSKGNKTYSKKQIKKQAFFFHGIARLIVAGVGMGVRAGSHGCGMGGRAVVRGIFVAGSGFHVGGGGAQRGGGFNFCFSRVFCQYW